MFNTQADLANKEAQLGYLSGALGTLPGVMKDIRMDKTDKVNELDLISLKASLLMSQLEILEIRIQLLLQSFEAKQQKK